MSLPPSQLGDLLRGAGGQLGPTPWGETALHFGDARRELQALRTSAGLLDLSQRSVIRLRGPDRVSFLHGMVTQDVKGLSEPGAGYTALLTPKGAMVSDARILRLPDQLLLDTEPGRGAKVLEFLNRYLISEDAELDDASSDWAYLSVAGPRSAELIRAALGDESTLPDQEHRVALGRFEKETIPWVASRRLGLPQLDALVPRQSLVSLAERLESVARSMGTGWVGFEAAEAARVEAGVPRFGQDLEETTIPLEADLTSALHYAKGCYIGQEVIARATHRGHMNRKLVKLTFSDGSEPPAAKTELRRGEKKVGWVTSALRWPLEPSRVLGLGYVHRDLLEPGTELELATGGTAKVTPRN